MIDLWLKLFDLLTQLAGITELRRRETFERLLVPIYQKFDEIHRDYMKLFQATRAACPELQANGQWTCERDDHTITLLQKQDVSDAIVRLKRDFLADREALDPDRILVRANASKYLAAPVGPQEKRFLWGILCYLLYPDRAIGSGQQIDLEIHTLVRNRKGSRSLLRTPSSKLFNKIQPLTNADDIYDVVDECERHLRARWAEVCELWADTQMTVIRSTTPLK